MISPLRSFMDMASNPRIEYEGAIYRMMCRGDRRNKNIGPPPFPETVFTENKENKQPNPRLHSIAGS